MGVLPGEMVLRRLRELPYEEEAFWREGASTPAEILAWLGKEAQKITSLDRRRGEREGAVEGEARFDDGKTHVKRAIFADAAQAAAFEQRLDEGGIGGARVSP